MKVFNLLKHDIKEGTFKNIRMVIIPILFWIICNSLTLMHNDFNNNIEVSFADYCLYCFSGADPIEFTQKLDLPILWLSIFILSCYITFDFMQRDISSMGSQIILRVGNRTSWWISKCFWCICTTVVYYIIALLSILIYCLFHGINISMKCNDDITAFTISSMCFSSNEILSINVSQFVIFVVLLSVTVLVALNMLQLFLSLFLKSINSFIISSTYILISVYYMHPLCIGSFGMVKNSILFVRQGFDLDLAFTMCILTIAIVVVMGAFVFKKYNIFQNDGD